MNYKEYFKKTYAGIIPHEIIALENAITALSIQAFDNGQCTDPAQCRLFCRNIKYVYTLLKPYEEKINSDIDELNGKNGYSFFFDIDEMYSHALQSMKQVCDLYHRYYFFIVNDDPNNIVHIESSIEYVGKEGKKAVISSIESDEAGSSNPYPKQSDYDNLNSEEESNPDYDNYLLSNARFRLLNLYQEAICKQYLHKWFEKGIDIIPEIKYVFWGKGKKTSKLIYKGTNKTLLANFCKFLSRDKSNPQIWEYFNKFIVDKNGKCVFPAKNPATYVREYDNYKKRLINDILDWTNKKEKSLSRDEKEDLK